MGKKTSLCIAAGDTCRPANLLHAPLAPLGPWRPYGDPWRPNGPMAPIQASGGRPELNKSDAGINAGRVPFRGENLCFQQCAFKMFALEDY